MTTNLVTIGKGEDGIAQLDVERLIVTRMLLCANSGGGKSYALRKIMEVSHDKVQQIIFDTEGEFKSLREAFDYVLIGKDGDIPISIKTATILPRKILELGVSVIIDMSELKFHERVLFVRRFLEALMELPQEYWQPLLVILDEAHIFAPEKGNAESAPAVIDLASRGRKRGYALLAATQRISKFNKDCAAELLNVMIGRTGLDIDQKRAADILGFTSKEQTRELRNLEEGEFYMFGAALSREVVKVKIGVVKTKHPKAGERGLLKTPPATDKVKEALRKFASLNLEAEKELHTLDDYKKEISDLRRQLTLVKKGAPAPRDEKAIAAQRGQVSALQGEITMLRKHISALERGEKEQKAYAEKVVATHERVLAQIATYGSFVNRMVNTANDVAAAMKKVPVSNAALKKITMPQPIVKPELPKSWMEGSQPSIQVKAQPREMSFAQVGELSVAQSKILNCLAKLEAAGIERAAKPMLAAFCRVSPTSGGYFNNLGALRSQGLIEYPEANTVKLTDSGRALAGDVDTPPDNQTLQSGWREIMSVAQEKILDVLIEIYPESITKNELAERVGASPTSGGYFNNLGSMRTMGALEYPEKGSVVASKNLFID